MKYAVVTMAALVTVAAHAQEFGHVLSATPVIGQVAVPQQFCQQGSVVVLGAAGAVAGMVGGALIGDRLDSRAPDQLQPVQTCTTQTTYEKRVLRYDVVYEYAGRHYAVQMPSDPGPTVQVQVTPVGALAPAPIIAAAPMAVAPSITTIQSSVEYVPYLVPINVAPVVIGYPSMGWGYPRHHYPRYAPQAYPRGPRHGQRPYWR